MTRLGFQIPNFTFPGVPDDRLFERVVTMAQAAESAGFDTVMVMDHFYQLPMLGPPDASMLECYAVLSALATRTERIRLSALVSGNTYRNPAHLAKIVTTLDLISGGRAQLGIGAGWFEEEHTALGFPFPSLGERLDRLEEALEIITAMFRGERPTFKGRFYNVEEAINSPAPLQAGGPPILIGGSGEKRTLRLVARFANDSNLTCAPAEIPRKIEALERHCKDLDRDPSTVTKSWLGSFVIAPTMEAAEAARNRFLAERGMNWDTLPEQVRTVIERSLVVGDPDSVLGFVQEKIIGAGLDGVIANLPANGHEPEIIALAGETLRKAVG
ncbi:MAG: LLM class F420-dependent oxidoreductase [Myxococcota bacterium]